MHNHFQSIKSNTTNTWVLLASADIVKKFTQFLLIGTTLNHQARMVRTTKYSSRDIPSVSSVVQ
jgi:hypothetical protein